MNDDARLPEHLEQFLQKPAHVPPAKDWQVALRKQTVALLPRRRRRWPLVTAAALLLAAASFYLGMRWRPAETAPRVEQKARQQPTTADKDQASDLPAPPAVAAVHPSELEWRAFDTPEDQTRARLYFKAGDLYLESQNDYESALRCYHQAIQSSGTGDLEVYPDDNWLVIALKRDHKER